MLKKKILLSLMAIMMVGSIQQASAMLNYMTPNKVEWYKMGYLNGVNPLEWLNILKPLQSYLAYYKGYHPKPVLSFLAPTDVAIKNCLSYSVGALSGLATVGLVVYGAKKLIDRLRESKKEVKTQTA